MKPTALLLEAFPYWLPARPHYYQVLQFFSKASDNVRDSLSPELIARVSDHVIINTGDSITE